jgi:hypothetical protein
MTLVGDDQMVMDSHTQSLCGGRNLTGQGPVPFGGFQASPWMVMLCAVDSYVE